MNDDAAEAVFREEGEGGEEEGRGGRKRRRRVSRGLIGPLDRHRPGPSNVPPPKKGVSPNLQNTSAEPSRDPGPG